MASLTRSITQRNTPIGPMDRVMQPNVANVEEYTSPAEGTQRPGRDTAPRRHAARKTRGRNGLQIASRGCGFSQRQAGTGCRSIAVGQPS